jgi:RNA polymerase sigma factor (sigma-70 family)
MDPLTYKKMILPIKDKLYRLAKMMLQTREEAEDALQDVLLKLWDNRQNLSGYRSVEALAMRMTRNQCLNRLRSPQYRRGPDAHAVEVGSPELTPDRSLEVHDSLRLMQRLVEAPAAAAATDRAPAQRGRVQLRGDRRNYGHDRQRHPGEPVAGPAAAQGTVQSNRQL